MRIEDAQLAHTYDGGDLLDQVHAVWGGVGWPGEGLGYAVVVAATKSIHMGSHDLYVLDEFETDDTRKLVRACMALNDKHWLSHAPNRRGGSSGRWVGDTRNEPGEGFIQEYNDEVRRYHEIGSEDYKPSFRLMPTSICEMDHLYSYMLPIISDLTEPRRLWLRDSKVVEYLREIDGSDIADLKLGAFPAIEALAYVVSELKQFMRHRRHAYSPIDAGVTDLQEA